MRFILISIIAVTLLSGCLLIDLIDIVIPDEIICEDTYKCIDTTGGYCNRYKLVRECK